MARLKDVALVWNNVKEVDLRPLREAALHELRIALVGAPGAGKHTLAMQMRRDPSRPDMVTQAPMAIITLEQAQRVAGADLFILLVDATRDDFSQEQALAAQWGDASKKVLVFCNKYDLLKQGHVLSSWVGWQSAHVLYGSALDSDFLQREFVPAVLELLPEEHLSLGRHFPIFRMPIARQLINDTCFSNTTYALSTGIAEIVPALAIPLNATDMVVLTKSQAFLAYKLGLLLGFSTRWQDYVGEFGSVLGGGFIWRQLARSLVGLIPVWGIVPKVAVSYAGTFVVGNAILQWYLTGRHLSPKQLSGMFVQAFTRGKDMARRLGRRKKAAAELPAGGAAPSLPEHAEQGEIVEGVIVEGVVAEPESAAEALAETQPAAVEEKPAEQAMPLAEEEPAPEEKPAKGKKTSKEKKPLFGKQKCPTCSKANPAKASFCQYCGSRLTN